jgi:hypothetical protein
MKRTTLILHLFLSVIFSSCFKFKPDNRKPDAPTNLQAQVSGPNSISINWTDNSNIEYFFEVEIKTGTGPFAACASPLRNITVYNKDNLSIGQTYTFRIRAAGDHGFSAYSNEVSVTL